MNELKQIFTDMLNHIDNHKQAYNLPEWTNERIVNAHIKTHETKLKKLFISGVVDSAVLETMHDEIFNEFHELRKKKGNNLSIDIDGKEVNEIIRLGKLKAKREHCL
jgi:hypothetical protein